MANFTLPAQADAVFSTDVYRIDTADPVLGYDGSALNIANLQARTLAENDLFLREKVDRLADGSAFNNESIARTKLVRGIVSQTVPRNTVVSGPYSGGARSLLSSSGTSLLVGVARVAFAAGFDNKGQVDFFGSTSSGTVAGSTPSTGVYYVYATSTNSGTSFSVNVRHTVLAPVYSVNAPDAPASGQHWYDTANEQMFQWNAGTSNWDAVLAVFIGQANRVPGGTWTAIETYEYRRDTNLESYVPAGFLQPYGGTAAPFGWMLCDGTEYQIDDYPRLFAAIGYTFGGSDGVFQVPDLRGRVIAGQDDMGGTAAGLLTTAGSGVDGATLGAEGGQQNITLTTAQIPPHTHAINTRNGRNVSSGGTDNVAMSTSANATMTSASTGGTAGTTQAHANVQPTLIANYIIKA